MPASISVIVAVYNRFDLLKQVVESILAQTYPVTEVILVDDGSIDDTPQVLPRYVKETPSWRERVKYIYQENQGQSVANNTGIAQAKGEWLGFSSNDDPWLPQKLEWQFRSLDQFKDKCQVCFTDAWFMNNPRMKMTLFQLGGRHHEETMGMIADPVQYVLRAGSLAGVHPVWVQTMVARTELVRRIGGLDAQLRYGEDDDFVFRLACETSFCYVGMPMLLIDRTPPEQRHVGAAKNFDKQLFRLQMTQRRFEKRLRMCDKLPPTVAQATRQSLREVQSEYANCHLSEGDFAKAREALTRAAGYNLTPSLALKWALARFAPGLARTLVMRRQAKAARNAQGIG